MQRVGGRTDLMGGGGGSDERHGEGPDLPGREVEEGETETEVVGRWLDRAHGR